MGYDLIRSDDGWRFRYDTWPSVLFLAQLGGWQPAGTKGDCFLGDRDQEPTDWDGSYIYNEGQLVSEEDARALADGLENLIDCTAGLEIAQLLDQNAEISKRAEDLKRLPDRRLRRYITDALVKDALQLLQSDDDRKCVIRDFVSFCRRGGFRIY